MICEGAEQWKRVEVQVSCLLLIAEELRLQVKRCQCVVESPWR